MLSVPSATNAAKRPDLPALTPRTASEDTTASKAAVVPPSPRPTSVEGLDQWFKELQNYETTLGAMATASSDPKFKEELGTIEQWFKLLSDSEQSATLYTLLQNGKPEQVRFIGAVVNQLTAETTNAQQQQQVVNPAVEATKTKHRPSSLNLPAGPLAPPAPAPKVNAPAEQAVPAQDVTATSTWASEVNTPMFKMFPTGDKGSATAAQQKLPNAGVVPGLAPGVGIPMLNPFNMAMLNNLGFSNEAQLLAVQMVMSGLVQPPPPPVQKPLATPKSKAPTGNWRGPGSAKYPGSALRSGFKSSGLKSSGLRSSGLKSSGLQSAGLTPLASAGATPKEADDIDPEMLKDIPAWMKSLRLHKYNSCFDGMTWEELVLLDDAQLEAKGVIALGARRRLTKTFELVKKKMGMETTPTVGDYVLASAALPHKGSSLSHELTDELVVPHSAAPTFSTAA